MKCDECELRYKCFTAVPRPKRLSVNWQVSPLCIRCKYTSWGSDEFKKINDHGSNVTAAVTICTRHDQLVHQFSSCKDFIPHDNRTEIISQIYKDIRDIFIEQQQNGLPKFCLKGEDIS
jgi:hypothetical protein